MSQLNIAGLTHIKGDLYECKLDLIKFAGKDTTLKNPRHLATERGIGAEGFDPVEMEKTRISIATDGLHHPPICRLANGKIVELMNGERRVRCLTRLVKDKTPCFNAETGQMEPADKLYSTVQIRLRENVDDKTAFRIAYTGNDNAVPIGEAANVAFVKYLRGLNYSDADIIKITGMSSNWLREADKLIELDDETFTALGNRQINRSVALRLSEMPEPERIKTLHDLMQCMKSKAVAEAKAAEEEAEEAGLAADKAVAEAHDEVAAAEDEGTPEAAEKAAKASEKAAKATAKAAKAKTTRTQKQAYTTKPAKIRDLNEVVEATGGEVPAKGLTWAKIEKNWIEPLEKALTSMDDTKFDRDYGRVVLACLKAIQEGETDYAKVLADAASVPTPEAEEEAAE
jgi:ParB-like chromosome segregation protein Spo0J